MTTTNKIILSIITFIILVVLIIVFIIYPLFGEIKKNSNELISQKESLATLEVKIANLEKFKILYKDLEKILEKINNLFIDPEVPVGFIGFLEKNAEDCQLTIKISLTSAKKTEKDPWPSLTFKITPTGPFPNFLKFLAKIENSPYLIEIQNLNVSRLGKGETSPLVNIQANLSIKVYTQ